MKEKFRQFMIGRYGTDGLNQALSIASIVMLLISLLTRISLFTWVGVVLLVLCYYRSLSRNISKRTEENYKYYTIKDRVDRKFQDLKDQWANRKVYQKDAGKISLCFELPHTSGSLYNMLGNFIFNHVNMMMIESRPIPGKNWEYRFFVDIEGNLQDAGVKNALRGLREEASNMKILGNY